MRAGIEDHNSIRFPPGSPKTGPTQRSAIRPDWVRRLWRWGGCTPRQPPRPVIKKRSAPLPAGMNVRLASARFRKMKIRGLHARFCSAPSILAITCSRAPSSAFLLSSRQLSIGQWQWLIPRQHWDGFFSGLKAPVRRCDLMAYIRRFTATLLKRLPLKKKIAY